MFIQVITAKVIDAEGLKRQVERWESDVRPGADGFLGSTSGITDDGRLVVLARFDSEEPARRNSDRPEQGEWWTDTEKMLDEVRFKDSVDVVTMRGGGSDDAGFVQVMRGRIIDQAKMEAIRSRMDEMGAAMAAHRPDVIGDVVAVHADGSYTDAVYFTSESDARAAEGKQPPPEMQAMFEEFMSAFEVDDYLDLKDPWLR
jgi:hypothetical protein